MSVWAKEAVWRLGSESLGSGGGGPIAAADVNYAGDSILGLPADDVEATLDQLAAHTQDGINTDASHEARLQLLENRERRFPFYMG